MTIAMENMHAFNNHLPVKVRFGEGIAETLPEVIKEVDRVVEVPVDRIVEVVREVPIEVPLEIPYKYYVNESGQVYDENGDEMDQRLFEKKWTK